MDKRIKPSASVAALVLIIAGIGVLISAPANAQEPEGTVIVAGAVDLCSNETDPPGDSRCTYESTREGGWLGTGPFTITATDADGTTTTIEDCAAGEVCSNDEAAGELIPAGQTITVDATGGGSVAAGSPA